MRSRTIALVGLVLVFALIAAACGDSYTGEENTTSTEATTTTTEAATTTTGATTTTTEPEPPPPLVVWADDKRAPIIEEIAPAFTEATGVDVEVTLVDFDAMRDEVATKGPAGEGPDIFIGAHDWVGELADGDIVAPIDLGGRDDEFTETGLNALKWDGRQYGLPYVTSAAALYYNTDLIPEAPTTLAELTAGCDAAGNAVANCLGIPENSDMGDAYYHYPFLSARGGYIFAYDPTTGFDTTDIGIGTEAGIAGAQILETLVKDGYIATTTYDEAKDLFTGGTEAFWITGPWEVDALQSQSDVNWSVTTLPTVEGGRMRSFVNVQGFYLSAFSTNADVAEDFLLNFVATPETMLALFEADPRGSAYLATIDAVEGGPVGSTFAASAAEGHFTPNVPEMGAVWDPVGVGFLAIRNGDMSAEEAMTTAAEQVATVIADR